MEHEITPVPIDDPTAVTLLREYLADIITRYWQRPATEAEIDQAIAEDPNSGLAPPQGAFLVARNGGTPAGCVGLRRIEAGIAELKRMYVRPAQRRTGMGETLLAAAEEHTRLLGCRTIRLDTRNDLIEARTFYAKHGFREIPAYNDNPHAEHWFEKQLA